MHVRLFASLVSSHSIRVMSELICMCVCDRVFMEGVQT